MSSTQIALYDSHWDEFTHAIGQTDRSQLLRWAISIPELAGNAGWRRVTGIADLAQTLCSSTFTGISNMFSAFQENRLGDYCLHTANDFSDACGEQITALRNLLQAATERPTQILPEIFFSGLGFYVGGGGVDGNGGIPDLDITLLGIGAHRSPITHSIIVGIGLETLCLASLNLFTMVYHNLPEQHQPFWDSLHEQLNTCGNMFLIGGSAGIAYHLAVDAVIQPAPLHDLPFSMPIEAHQTLLAANALAEVNTTAELKKQLHNK
jgi:hypothetical protein